ncbi:C2 calcium-dependent domain-containing protein 4C [Nothoprocta perdicaria]|uniref:C2 calcium-dependent domain-containing protein 4C n=1 Tax=Nothoprocta perdicaria TaxID=30464 RepID=UPI000E1BA199|nr:C2 calcium-dependent domain-containing protein 4C [Nothoprocta perdicaria]
MWLLERLRGAAENGRGAGPEEPPRGARYSNVLTPDKIPDFFIPPKLSAAPAEAEGTEPPAPAALGASASEQDLAGRRPPRSPRAPSRPRARPATRHVIQVESAEDWAPDELGTNADPQAQTAMSLPYVPKAQTSYGFATLVESPHTRRKESLFHSEHGSLCPSPAASPGAQRRARPEGEGSPRAPADLGAALMHPGRYFSGGESDTCSSAESSPFGSPLLSRSVSLLKVFGQESQAKVVKLKHSVARNSSLSTDESSADTSPSAQRRARSGPAEPRGVNCCVSLCLVPGKLQKQRSTIVKNSRNPVFNEDFFFDGLGPGHARKMSLKLKVVNKGSSLKRDTLLGEKELPLTSLLPCL